MHNFSLRYSAALLFPVIAAALLCTVFSSCEEKYTSPAERILAESVKEMGGMDNATSWETRVQKGLLTNYNPGWGTLRAEYTIHVKKPDKMKIDQDFSAFDHPFYYTYYYNDGVVWAEVNMNVRQHPRYTSTVKKSYREMTEAPTYYMNVCDTFFVVEDLKPDSLLTEADYDRVGCVMEGDTTYFDISRKTHRPVRIIEEGDRQLILEEFREVNGYMYPFRQTVYAQGAKYSEVLWDDISFDVKIDNAVFEENMPEPEPEPEPETEPESETEEAEE